jgi:site-specific recombinase XerD
MKKRVPLPEPYENYLNLQKKKWAKKTFMIAHNRLKSFSIWIETENKRLFNLTSLDVQKYSQYLKIKYPNKPNYRVSLMGHLRMFVVENSESKIIQAKLIDIYPNYKFSEKLDFKVPKFTTEYYELLRATCADSSVKRYQVDIRRFHIFIKKNNINLNSLNRRHMELFLKYLNKLKIYPSTRLRSFSTIKAYLNWLWAHTRIANHPDTLLIIKDRPKVPKMLPKPFSLDMDNKLHSIFLNSDDIFYKGFLLMRKTGIRVGELVNLEFDCIVTDLDKNIYLKVPLGKLNSERMVPLSLASVDLIKKIQAQSSYYAKQNNIIEFNRLILKPNGEPCAYGNFRIRMADIQSDYPVEQVVQSHKLRHTCASELVNAGMSLFSLKEFLGHKDIHMTLKYSALSPIAVSDEYNKTLSKLQEKFPIQNLMKASSDSSKKPLQINDLITNLTKRTDSHSKKIYTLIRRLRRIKNDLENI